MGNGQKIALETKMLIHTDLQEMQNTSLRLQNWIRQETFSPQDEKTLRRFSSWEVSELILHMKPGTFRSRLAADPALPTGKVEPDGRQRWFTLAEVNTLRRKLRTRGGSLMPHRPSGRAFRTAIANFKGGAGKSTLALHFAHAAALDGYRVLCIDFDPQATLSHAMGLTDVGEEGTVWGIMLRDLVHETEALNSAPSGAESGTALPRRSLPRSITDVGAQDMRPGDFIQPTNWPTIDIIPSCANAAFVEFVSAQYRHLNPEWSFFAAVDRYLGHLPDEQWDMIIFDCPPAIGYQSMNAVFAADMLYIPSGPGYWEYDSTTSFVGQLAEALHDMAAGAAGFRLLGPSPPAEGVPRRPVRPDQVRTFEQAPHCDVRRVPQGVRGSDGGAPGRNDACRGAVRAFPELGLRDGLPRDDQGNLASCAAQLRQGVRGIQGDVASALARHVGRILARGQGSE